MLTESKWITQMSRLERERITVDAYQCPYFHIRHHCKGLSYNKVI